MDKLKLLAMLLLTRPYHDDCKPYEMLKEMEQRSNEIVEKSFEAGLPLKNRMICRHTALSLYTLLCPNCSVIKKCTCGRSNDSKGFTSSKVQTGSFLSCTHKTGAWIFFTTRLTE